MVADFLWDDNPAEVVDASYDSCCFQNNSSISFAGNRRCMGGRPLPCILIFVLCYCLQAKEIYTRTSPVFSCPLKNGTIKTEKDGAPCAEHRPQFIPLYPPDPFQQSGRGSVRPEAATPPLSSRRGERPDFPHPFLYFPGERDRFFPPEQTEQDPSFLRGNIQPQAAAARTQSAAYYNRRPKNPAPSISRLSVRVKAAQKARSRRYFSFFFRTFPFFCIFIVLHRGLPRSDW